MTTTIQLDGTPRYGWLTYIREGHQFEELGLFSSDGFWIMQDDCFNGDPNGVLELGNPDDEFISFEPVTQ